MEYSDKSVRRRLEQTPKLGFMCGTLNPLSDSPGSPPNVAPRFMPPHHLALSVGCGGGFVVIKENQDTANYTVITKQDGHPHRPVPYE
jgi:hypothetical protein